MSYMKKYRLSEQNLNKLAGKFAGKKQAQSMELEGVVNEVISILKSRHDADIQALPMLLDEIKEGVIDKVLGQTSLMYDEMG